MYLIAGSRAAFASSIVQAKIAKVPSPEKVIRMRNVRRGLLFAFAVLTAVATAYASTPPNNIAVDCSKGQSLNQTLAKLDKQTPTTISVNGTCSEYVNVVGFENLILKGMPGATLAQPSGGSGSLFTALLLIESSRSVTVTGFDVQADTTISAIAIGHGSSDIRLRNLNITGGGESIEVFENSQVSIAYVTAQAPGYTTLGIYDLSDVHLERSQFSAAPGAGWNVGIALGASHVTMYDTTISNMQVGISAGQGSIVDLVVFNTYYSGGPTDVKILNPAGTSFNGVAADGGSSLNIFSARLLIDKPGQTWAGTTGGVLLSNGSSMGGYNGNMVILGSNGQGVVALNNSHATLSGVTVSGSAHGGLVAMNLSSIDMAYVSTFSTISGNSVDLFCDSTSWLTGTANISGKFTAQCSNQLTSETVALP
jgi:hypothetical protein